jgi:uncharacterized protein (DUF2141 family)
MLLLAVALPLLTAAAPQARFDVRVAVTQLRSSEGVVRACMTPHPDRFPSCRDDPAAYSLVVPASEADRLQFESVRPGTYAIALLHDENENGKADRALGMVPREGFGFSHDAPVRLGPPDFQDAAFAVRGASVQQTIRMRYML